MRLFDRDSWREVAQTLRRNKRRSIVTAFGIFWGIFMLIVLLAIGSGFRNGIDDMTRGVANNTVGLFANSTSKPFAGFKPGRELWFTYDDLEAIQAEVPEVMTIGAERSIWSDGSNIQYQSKRASNAAIRGITPTFFALSRPKLLAGRLFSTADHREGRKICVIGERVAQELFGKNYHEALDKIIMAGRSHYLVVGVVTEYSRNINIGVYPSRSILVPLSVLDISEGFNGQFHTILAGIDTEANNEAVIKRIKQVLQHRHQVSADDDVAFESFDISEVFQLFEGINLGINILVWIVGIGTLLTGIVGISNILMVTVRERTQEIGVRRALGARPRDIMLQLLMEALSLTLIAGLSGLTLGVSIMALLSQATGGDSATASSGDGLPFSRPEVSFEIAMIALVIIILSGLLASILPARKAVEVRAIEAIREE